MTDSHCYSDDTSLIRMSVVCEPKWKWSQVKCLWASEKHESAVSLAPLLVVFFLFYVLAIVL